MDDTTKILAMTECLILWDYLAETGDLSKLMAIEKLYKDGKLSCGKYMCDCPFCSYLRCLESDGHGCESCLWPVTGGPDYVLYCERDGSPYRKWLLSRTKEDKTSAAVEVLRLLESIEF